MLGLKPLIPYGVKVPLPVFKTHWCLPRNTFRGLNTSISKSIILFLNLKGNCFDIKKALNENPYNQFHYIG